MGAFGALIQDVNGLAATRNDVFFGFDLDGFNIGASRRLISVNEGSGAAGIIATVAASIFSLDFSPDQVLYGTNHPSNNGGNATLVTQNTVTGAIQAIGSVGFNNVNGIKFVPKPSTLLGITVNGTLLRIDRRTGQGTLIAETGLSQVRGGLEVDRNGDLLTTAFQNDLYRIDLADPTNPFLIGDVTGYVVVESLSFDPCTAVLYGSAHASNVAVSDELIEIDTTNGTPTPVGFFGALIKDLNGLASNARGQFFGFDLDGFNLGADRRLVSIVEQTGVATPIAVVNESIYALDFSPEGTLYGTRHPSNNGGAATLVILDPQTGAVTTVGAVGHDNINGIVFAPLDPSTAVPSASEPILALIAVSLVASGVLFARRRSRA